MKLLIDIGNTRLKWGYCGDSTDVSDHGALSHKENGWQQKLPTTRPDSVWVANVAGAQIESELQSEVFKRWQLRAQRVTSNAQLCGVKNAYPRPQRLGVDRWMACIAGYHSGAGSVLVADAGTAITLDFVDVQGSHKGGLISPGVATMRQALRGGTRLRAELQDYELAWLTDDTDPAVGLGTLQSALALLENAQRKLQPDRCLLTGGEAPLLFPHLPAGWQQAPHLVLEGLAYASKELQAEDTKAGQQRAGSPDV